jgi:ribosomal protein S8
VEYFKNLTPRNPNSAALASRKNGLYTNHVPKTQEVGGIFVCSGFKNLTARNPNSAALASRKNGLYTNHVPKTQEVGGIFVCSGSELKSF